MLSLVHRPSLLSHTEEGRVFSGWVSLLFVSLIPPLSPGKSFTIWPLEICVLYVVVICNEKTCDGDVLPLSMILGHCQSAYPLKNIFKCSLPGHRLENASTCRHDKSCGNKDDQVTRPLDAGPEPRLEPAWDPIRTLSGQMIILEYR